MMKEDNLDRRSFLNGGLGYLAGAVAGFLFIFLVSWLGIPGWLFRHIEQNQALLQVLSIPLIAGLLLALGGAVLGAVGGWTLARMINTQRRTALTIGSALAFAISISLLSLIFLLIVSLLALYNNLTTDRIEQYGIIFGLFGLVFGLLTGILLGLMTVRLRHSWRVILASVLGFTLGWVLSGILVRLVNPTAGFKTYPILTTLALLLALALPFALGGGALGFTYNRLARRASRKETPVESIQPSTWQLVIVGLIVLGLGGYILSILGQVSNFLTINPANLQTQIAPVTIGVRFSEPQPFKPEAGELALQPADQEAAKVEGPDQTLHQAWCSPDGVIHYQRGDAAAEKIIYPGCMDTPSLAFDAVGQPHMVWYTQEIKDTNGVPRPASLLVESIRSNSAWSEAAIAARTSGPVTPSLSASGGGDLRLVWDDPEQGWQFAVQEAYNCDEEELSQLERAALAPVLSGGYLPEGEQLSYCRNQYERILYTPNPVPGHSETPVTDNGAFDINASLAERARYEVLFATMQYEPNDAPPSPGSILAESVAYLYQQVKANPEDYPRGMTVRIMLGNYPEMSDFAWGNQIYDAISDLRAAGVEKMVDPEIGWRLEVANFPGTYPHSHTKFIIIDGSVLGGAGFNYGYLHLPKEHPSGRGYDMLDLGIVVSGPVAQDAISTYDDMWDGADQIQCEDFHPPEGKDWKNTCREVKATSDHIPEVLRTYLPPEGDSHAFSLYRSQEYKVGDEFIAASLAAATESIDMMQVNFSLELICMANVVFPDLCTIDNALPYMHALLDAIEENGAHLRVIMENTNSNGLENRVSGNVFLEELARRGLSDQVDLRFYNGKIHAKSTLIDGGLLIIGSQNMHYSSWGENGLTEYSLATNDPKAIAEYEDLFETKWQEAIPFEEAEYGSSP